MEALLGLRGGAETEAEVAQEAPRRGQAAAGRPPACSPKDLTRLECVLPRAVGELAIVVLLGPGQQPRPGIIENCACYSSLRQTLEQKGQFWAQRGYAYILACERGSVADIADHIFASWRADAESLLDWVAVQPWSDGRVGVRGVSLMGAQSFALLQAGASPAAPPGRARVLAAAPALAFSRIHPTIFLWGQGLAVELVLRFLWLAEVGCREGQGRVAGLVNLARFFVCRDFPGLRAACEALPMTNADQALWQRQNKLWREGLRNRSAEDDFWREGRDVLCDIQSLGPRLPPLRITAGWWDVFLRQSLDDYAAARRARGAAGGVELQILAGGHFGVGMRLPGELSGTLAWFDEHLLGHPRAPSEARRPVRLEVIGGAPGECLELGAWPPALTESLELFAHPPAEAPRGAASPRLGRLERRPLAAAAEPLAYTYDPRDPTPYAGGSWLGFRKDGPQDQAAVEGRGDVLVLTSPALEAPLDVLGAVRAVLHLRSSAEACDVVVRLCAVRAAARSRTLAQQLSCRVTCGRRRPLTGGTSTDLCESITRVDFRGKAAPDGAVRVELEVGVTCCRFHAGDRIRLHVCSAAHPKYLRHPLAPGGDTVLAQELGPPALQELLLDPERPSSLRLPLHVRPESAV